MREEAGLTSGSLPIDRGWAWCACLGTFLVILLTSGTSRASGIIFQQVSDTFECSNQQTSWFVTVFIACSVVTSPIATALSDKISARKVIFMGGVLAACGSSASSFAHTLTAFILIFSIPVGVGFGFCFAPAIAATSQYFEKRRSLAMGLAMSGGAFGAFIIPPVIALLIDRFAFRGMLLVLGAIFTHFCLGAMLLRPTSVWRVSTKLQVPRNRRNASCFGRLIHNPLLKSPALYLRGIPLALFTDVLPYSYMMLPGLCFEAGLSMRHVTLVLLLMGIPDIFGRLGIGWVADKGWMKRAHMLAIIVALQAVIWAAVSLLITFESIAAFALVLGTLGGAVMTLMAPVMVDALGVAHINSALGFIMLSKLLFFGVPILLGAIKDATGSWAWSFRIVAALIAMMEIVFLLDTCRTRKPVSKPDDTRLARQGEEEAA